MFVLGTIVASFMYVIANLSEINYRVLSVRSKCDNCDTTLQFYKLIPVLSYLFLKRKCKFCHQNIPVENFLIEILLGVAYVLPTLSPFENSLTAHYYLFVSILIPLTFIDIKKFIVPNHMLIILIFSGVSLSSFEIEDATFKFLSISLLILFYPFISKYIGFGDIKLFSTLFLLLPLNYFIMIFLVTFIIGGMTIITFEIFLKDKHEKYPLVPFITIALVVVFIKAKEFSSIYGGLI